MNCPKCGAEGTLLRSYSVGLYYDFDCGSSTVCEGEEFEQSAPCRELCDLRKRVAFAEKWRDVVLRNAASFLDNYVIEHVLVADPSDSETVGKAFDAAVRKEME